MSPTLISLHQNLFGSFRSFNSEWITEYVSLTRISFRFVGFLQNAQSLTSPLSCVLASPSAVSCRLKLMLSLPNWTTSHWSIEMSWRLAMTLQSPRENRGHLGHYLSPQKCVFASSSFSAGKGQAWNAPTVIIQHTQCSPIPSVRKAPSLHLCCSFYLPVAFFFISSTSSHSSFAAGFYLFHVGKKIKGFTTEYFSSLLAL